MKILILGSKEYPFGSSKDYDPISGGGMEVFTENLSKALAKYVSIGIITRKFPKQKKYELTNSINIYRVPYINGFYLRTPSFIISSFFKALDLEYDVIITHGVLATVCGVFLSKLKNKKVITVPHGIAHKQPQYFSILKSILKFLESYAYKNSDFVIFLSKEEKKNFVKTFNFLPKNRVIPPAVEISKYRIKDKSILKQFKTEGKIIIFIGRLIDVKGIEYLIKALPMLKKTYTCFIVGDGPQRAELQQLAKKLKTKTIFTGFRKDVEKFLAISNVYVLPSLAEGLPLSLLEAMAAGIPCVVTDIPLPLTSKEAVIVKKANAKMLAFGINKILRNKKLSKKLTKNALKFVNRFSWDKTVREYLKLIS